MSIQKKIMLANLITFLLVVAFMLLFSFFMLKVYTNNYLKPNAEDIYNKDDNSISLSEIKVIMDDVHDEVVEHDGYLENGDHYNSIRKFLESTNSTLALTKNNTLYFISNVAQTEAVMNLISNYALANTEGQFNALYSDKDSMVICSNVELNNGETVSIFLINGSVTAGQSTIPDIFSNYENSRSERYLILIALAGIGVVALISGSITMVISRNVIKPLKKLKKGTKDISEGNLDSDVEIDDSNDREINEVIYSFNSMRETLKATKEENIKYENSRKELIAGISHDLKTPVTNIKGYAQGLLDGVADTPEKQDKYLRTILSTAENMDHLVEELSNYSKLDLDKIEFEFEPTDIGNYLEDCSEEMKFAFENDKLVVSFQNRLEKPLKVLLDKNRFGRVLINIARNSVKYKTEEVGSLHIDLSSEDGKMIRIEMKDNGMGVEKENLEKIFDSFYRTDKSRANYSSGSGLGLSIAKRIVLAHKGKIYAESILGQGLSVIIELPVAEAEK